MRKKIGILMENTDDYNRELIRGAYAATKENDADLIVFTGSGAIASNEVDHDLNKHNMSYSFANLMDIDHLLIPVSNLILENTESKKDFLKSFRVPITTLNYYDSEFSSVCYDSKQSIKDAINCMIQNGAKRIAFIGGDEHRNGTINRLMVYKQALAENHIRYNKNYTCYCPDYTQHNHATIRPFLKAHPEIDGIFCVTDRLAYCVYDVCHELHRKIGEDLLISGFDDNAQSNYMAPPLASVHADSALLAYVATTSSLSTKNKLSHETIGTSFIRRHSIGSDNHSEDLKNLLRSAFLDHLGIEELAQGVTIYIFDNKIIFDNDLRDHMAGLITLLLKAEPDTKNLQTKIHDALSQIITIENIKFLDIDQLNTTFTVIFDYRRRVYRPDHEKLEFLSKLQDLAFNEFILLYSSLIASLNSMNTNKTITLNMISRLSLNVRQKDRIYRLAVDTLNQINIKNAMLLIYPKELTYVRTAYNFSCPDMFFLKGHVRDGQVVDTHNAFFTVNQLLEVFPGDYKTISTISFNEHQYGLLITDASPDQLSDVEFLVSQIGNTIYITGILENLNLQSITDELTGVFNRRGILEKLTETVASLRHDEFAYILFVDLDHLKLINDKYGHDAGDQAIKAQADVLTEAFPRDLVGRIGGDEFMVILKTRYPSFIATVSSRIEESEAKIRHSRHFKFPFRLSYGMSVFDHNYSEDEIQRVIDNADSFMYQQKQQHHRESDFDEIGKN